jgi:dipeptidyl aminopeptidase/acylaminoacyl peptidase
VHGGAVHRLFTFHARYPVFAASSAEPVIAYVDSPASSPGDVWLHPDGGPARRITTLNPSVAALRHPRVRQIDWSSSLDGERLVGALVQPSQQAGESRLPPLITLLHGGPHFHWDTGWQASVSDWAHLLADRGYTVLLPNPRGSTGRDWPFAHGIRGRIGTLPLQDVLDGIDSLIEQGVADGARLGVGGWSYGGFLTAWAITQTRRFRAAVVGAGISDFYTFIGASPMGTSWRTFFPDARFPDRAGFDECSPMSYLRDCTTPTLVIHGDRDPKISPDQGRALHRGLLDCGTDSALVILPGAGHKIDDPDGGMTLMNSMLDWFAQHLPAD